MKFISVAVGVFPIILIYCCVVCSGSLGDISYEFSFCKDKCFTSKCGLKNREELSWGLKWTGWSCRDNCLYTCMHQVTAEDIRQGKPVRQFFGKVSLLIFNGKHSAIFQLSLIINNKVEILWMIVFLITMTLR